MSEVEKDSTIVVDAKSASSGLRRASRYWVPIALGLLVVFLVLLPTQLQRERYYMHLLILICLFVSLSMSFNLVWGYAGLLSLAQAGFMGIGAYTTANNFFIDFVAALAVSAVLAFILGIPALRLARTSFVMVTLAFFLVLYVISQNWNALTNGAMGIAGIAPARFVLPGGLDFSLATRFENYYLFLTYTIIVIAVVVRIVHSRVGRVLVAIRQDEILAQSFGVNIFKYKLLVFVIASTLAGGVGSLYAHYISFVGPQMFDQYWNTRMILITVVGGRGSIVGVAISGVFFTLLPEYLRFAQELREVAFGIAFTIAVALMPRGIVVAVQQLRKRFARPKEQDAQG
jgi:branched-chain amino acid transport system permease protein